MPTDTRDDSTVFLPEIWGPHYWFFLFTVALSYPDHVNAVTKRKYYDLVQNMPIFIPNEHIAKEFSNMLNAYPVTPYLDHRDSFVRWVVFIHNKVNEKLGKPEITPDEAMDLYFRKMVPRTLLPRQKYEWRKYAVYAGILSVLMFLLYILYSM